MKVEPEEDVSEQEIFEAKSVEDVSEQEIFEAKSVEDYVTEQEFVQEAKALEEGIVYEESHYLPETGQVEAGEVSSPASSARVN